MRYIGLQTTREAVSRLFEPFGPIQAVYLKRVEKPDMYGKISQFAFVRFVVPEAASLAIEQTNNTLLEGSTIKVTSCNYNYN